jgi:hypothetical protein
MGENIGGIEPEHMIDKELISFYELFLSKVKVSCYKKEKTVDELTKEMEVNKVQLNKWLKCAVEEGKLKKMTNPVRYQWINKNDKQMTIW